MTTDLAAIDLGSNSFHMIIARVEDDKLVVVDRIKEMVRLAGGLDEESYLRGPVVDLALVTLERFSERLRSINPANIRAVGTNTMRRAKNAAEFMHRAETALSHNIEIVSGIEEARLIYLGVAHSFEWNSDPRLVVDIGGGSTELIVGEQFNPWLRESKYMGCVEWSRRYFGSHKVDAESFAKAVRSAKQEMGPSTKRFRNSGFLVAVGASGTIKAVQTIVAANGWSETMITREALSKLSQTLVDHGDVSTIELPGLDPERRPVLAGGVAILQAIFESLDLQEMMVSDGAMREGILHDLLGRIEDRDVRETTIDALARRYNVDQNQADAVEKTALDILAQVETSWGLQDELHRQHVRWTSRIHEIGLAIAHSGYQKHGSYLVEKSDMPGFSRQDQRTLWALVRSHRRKIKAHRFDSLANPTLAKRVAVIIRLAALLNRTRDKAPPVQVEAEGNRLTVTLPDAFLAANPLTYDDLETERSYLENIDIELVFNDR